MPTRLIDSTPPPIAMSCWPDITCAAAKFTASRPEAQKRLICTPGTPLPKPATERRHAGNVAARFADRIDATEDHVVDQRGVETVALLHRREHMGGEIERRHLVQRCRPACRARAALRT